MQVLLIDWLGRGGIAQCTEAWAIELAAAGCESAVVCPPGRELVGIPLPAALPEGRLRRHWALADIAAQLIRERRPDVVVLNNYLVPVVEQRVVHATHSVGARVVGVVHNVRPHSAASASSVRLGRLLRSCDELVVHSRHEEQRLGRRFGLAATFIPHPVQVGMLGPVEHLQPVGHEGRVVCQFGVMKRRYKGAELLPAFAKVDAPWDLVALGVGAPAHPGLESVARFLPADELVGLLRSCSIAVFPYRAATQSGAVVLAKALGLVPVATDVGALSEQISHGSSGLILPPGAEPPQWLDALMPLRDRKVRQAMGQRALEEVRDDHEDFRRRILDLVIRDEGRIG